MLRYERLDKRPPKLFKRKGGIRREAFERYRNRCKRFGLRFNLISGLLNYELTHPI